MVKLSATIWVIVYILFASSCQAIRLSDRIRPFDNQMWRYHFTKDSAGHVLSYDDTLICKMLVRYGVLQGGRNRINRDIFYFDTPNHPDTSMRDIYTYDVPVSQFTYCFDKHALYMAEYYPREQNPPFMAM